MRRLLWLVPLLWGCSDPARPTIAVLDAGGAQLELSDAPSLTLARDGTVLLRFDAAGFSLGLVSSVSDDHNYDPYRLEVPSPLYDPPSDLAFVAPEGASFAASEPGTLALELRYPGGVTARLDAAVHGEGRFALRLTPSGNRTAFVRLAAHGDPGEGFYGLGEYFDDVNHRGHIRAMQIETDGAIESLYNEAHVPVPVVSGTTGWGMFVESPYPGAFTMGVASPEQVQATFGTATLPFYLYAAEHPLDLTRHYYSITGWPRLPARWALGPWVWRDENDDQAQVESDIELIRDLDLATTGYWIDRPYATAVNSFDFAPNFPDPAAMIAHLHDLGFRTALWHTPYLDEDDPATASLRQTAKSEGYYPPESDIYLNGWGRPIDLTNEDARAWWRDNLGAYVALGVEGFKLDYGEDVLNGLFLTRSPWRFADGRDERTMHSQFTRVYHDTYAPLLPDDGGFLLCRAGTYGDQVNGIIIWPGDLDASFARHREEIEVDGKTVLAAGGLPASIVAGLSLGPSGFPFYGADTGGYRHSPTDKELFMRWFEQTALSTVMQIGTSANDVAWELGGENGFDEELLDRYREYTRLHLRLFPYLWSYAQRLLEDGRPIQRALGIAHPELGLHPNDIYLLGDHLLVAPVVERGATRRSVIFPAGKWVHFFTGEVFEGPGEHEVDAPLGRLPLFLHEDGIVPLLRPTIDTLAEATDPEVDSYATDPGLLWVRMVAGGTGAFDLFDGGRVAQTRDAGTSEVSCASGSELDRGCLVAMADAPAPVSVTGDEHGDRASLEVAPSGWFYDAASRTLWVKLPPGDTPAIIGW